MVPLEIGEDGLVQAEERVLRDLKRTREVEIDDEGSLLLITDQENGRLLRITRSRPAAERRDASLGADMRNPLSTVLRDHVGLSYLRRSPAPGTPGCRRPADTPRGHRLQKRPSPCRIARSLRDRMRPAIPA
ncbi:MAG: PQQ-dependent sugar dehydrogenase [Defluviimonas sp.]|nr:PQQ-dependent sugar dehydrogenase [Defluviimonas sp.]